MKISTKTRPQLVMLCAHHASCPAVHNFSQAKLELGHKIFNGLCYPTLPLQLTNTLCHRKHLIDALGMREEKNRFT